MMLPGYMSVCQVRQDESERLCAFVAFSAQFEAAFGLAIRRGLG